MRIILYGLGKLYHRYKESIRWSDVIAVSDGCPTVLEDVYPVPCVTPSQIQIQEFDYVAIFSNQFFDEIRADLVGKYFIKKGKIISWRAALSDVADIKQGVAANVYHFVRDFVTEEGYGSLLDVGMRYLSKFTWLKCIFGKGRIMRLDGIRGEADGCLDSLYDHIYSSCHEVCFMYDVALLCDVGRCIGDGLDEICGKCRKVIAFSTYTMEDISNIAIMETALARYGKVRRIFNSTNVFWLVDIGHRKENGDLSIYVVTHKPYGVPDDYPYHPLCVGGYRHVGYQSEGEGENISFLNHKINECTALYWMWKYSSSKYVGLNHYRRFFYNDSIRSLDNFLDAEHAEDLLDQYDIILPCSEPTQCTVKEEIFQSVSPDAFRQAMGILKARLKKLWPDYSRIFDLVMNSYHFYKCNMFVTHRKILHAYCSWLFSFLIDAAEEFDERQYDDYSKRALGFFAERMLTVWLYDKKLKIKELPFFNPTN